MALLSRPGQVAAPQMIADAFGTVAQVAIPGQCNAIIWSATLQPGDPIMAHRTGITLRLTPADRTALEALQAFTRERTATRAIKTAPLKRYPDTCRAVENAEADRDQARLALQELLDALDEVDSAQSSLNRSSIQGLRQDAGSE